MAASSSRSCRVYLACVALFALIAYVLPLHGSDVLTSGEHFANVNGVRLWYRVAGHGPILVVQPPGWGPGSALLQRFLAPAERNLTVVYLEPRGNGKSSRPEKDTQMSTLDMADDLEALRAFLGLEKIAVLGHSHGATIASIFAVKHPDHVNHLILVAGGIPKFPTPELDAELKKIYDGLANDPRYADAVKASREDVPNTDEGFGNWFNRMAPFYWHDVTKAKALEGLPPINTWAGEAMYKSDGPRSVDLVADLKKLSAPALIIEGKRDLITTPLELETLRSTIPHSRLVVFEQSGHFPMIEEQEKFTQMVSGFVRE